MDIPSRFDTFIPFILQWETEYQKGHDGDDKYVRVEHDPDDPGGTTKYGIDRRSHPHVDIPNLTKAAAITIYHDEWTQEAIEPMPPKLGEAYFNAAVNAGVKRAKSLLVVSKGDAASFIEAQAAWYQRLVNAKPSFKKYLVGWENRLKALQKYLKL